MTWLGSVLLLILFICGVFILLRGQETNRRTTAGNALMLEYRTDLPLDECMDLLRAKREDDLFDYTYARSEDGTFALHFTMHRATKQPVDTLYTLRLESGRQTVISLTFVREAFGYREPVFPIALLDEFFTAKLSAQRIAL